MLRTTLGQLLINNALPERLRDYNRVLDKKGMTELLRTVALEHPEDYREISKKLADIGREAATESGGNSFGLVHMKKAKAGLKYQKMMQERLARILDRDDLTDEQRNDLIIKAVGSLQEAQADEILKESVDEKNPLAMQVASGTRGNKMNLASLRGSDVLYTDHRDHVLPLPVVHSFSQGLSPVEYWANTYGARKGVMATKFATQDAGFLSKQLNQIAHRLMVVGDDYDEPEQQALLRGYPTDTNDKDNEGALLAKEIGGYPKNTVLTPKILKELSRRGIDKLLVRSPAVGGSSDGGVYARDVGVRERGVMPGRGEQVGLQAAQALSEPLSQAQLAAKHSGGVVGQEKAVGGFQGINQLVQVPETFRGGAAHSEADGIVQRIEPAPAGGSYVYINNQQHYVPQNYELKVKKGERVEAGDVLSEGVPNPYIITKHKGIGEGRRYFINAMRDAMGGAGLRANRRNLEILARGLINHVRLTDEMGDNVADDIIPYTTLEHTHQPREGYKDVSPDRAVGMYLERPVLHYTIGTKIRPSVVQTLKDYGVESVTAHADPVAFEPEMIRGMASLQHDPDWQTRLYGSGQKSSLLDAVHRGGSSTPLGTSFVPGLAKAVNFGQEGLVRQPEPGTPPEEINPMPAKTPPRHALDLTKIEPLPSAPKSSFRFSNLLKLSDDASAVREAQALMEKVGAELGFTKTAEPGNTSTGQIDRQPAGPKPNTSSPLHAGVGNVPGSNAPPPQAQPAVPAAIPGGNRAQRRQAQQQPPAADPNVVQQRRNAQARHYSSFENQGGYTPGRGIYDQNDSIEQVRAYIGDPNQGFSGGQFGAAVRLFNLIDPNAVGTLTRGNADREEYRGLSGSMGGVTPETATASVQPKLPQLPQAQPRPQAPPQVPQQAPPQPNQPTPQAQQYQQIPMSGGYDDRREAAQTALSTYGFWPYNTPLPNAVAAKYNMLTHQFAEGQIDSAAFYQQAEQLKKLAPTPAAVPPTTPAAQPAATASPYPQQVSAMFGNRVGSLFSQHELADATDAAAAMKRDNVAQHISRMTPFYGKPVDTWDEHRNLQNWLSDPLGTAIGKTVTEPLIDKGYGGTAITGHMALTSFLPNTAPELAKSILSRVAAKEMAEAATKQVVQKSLGGKMLGWLNPLGWLATGAQIAHPLLEDKLVDQTWANTQPVTRQAGLFHDVDPTKYKTDDDWNRATRQYLLPQPENAPQAVVNYNKKWSTKAVPTMEESLAAMNALAELQEKDPNARYFGDQWDTGYRSGYTTHEEALDRYNRANRVADNILNRHYYNTVVKPKRSSGQENFPTFIDPDKTARLDALKWEYARTPGMTPDAYLQSALKIYQDEGPNGSGRLTRLGEIDPATMQQWQAELPSHMDPDWRPTRTPTTTSPGGFDLNQLNPIDGKTGKSIYEPPAPREEPIDFWEEFTNRGLVPKDGVPMHLVNEWAMLQQLQAGRKLDRAEAMRRALESYQQTMGR